jgi:hypothetical protein
VREVGATAKPGGVATAQNNRAAAREEEDGDPAAQRSEDRRCEIHECWVPATGKAFDIPSELGAMRCANSEFAEISCIFPGI